MRISQVVLIEDNPADVLLVKMALKENGVACQMTIFKTGQEAVEALCPPSGTKKKLLVPDAILLDLNTPKSDGFEVLGILKKTPRLVNVPVAIITSSQAASDKARTYRIGAIRYIQKSAQLEEFLNKVGQAVKEMLSVREMPESRRPSE
jgi:two-component system response regulator